MTAGRAPADRVSVARTARELVYMFKFTQSYPDRVTYQQGSPAH